MKPKITLIAAIVIMLAAGIGYAAEKSVMPIPTSHPVTDPHQDWRLGVQTYTFKEFTFFEAVEKVHSLGLNWLEVWPGHKLGGPWPDTPFIAMDDIARAAVRAKLADANITLVNMGVCNLNTPEAEARKLFEFAREMGIETILAEPRAENMDMVEALVKEYGINVAIHNHPQPSTYWNPDTTLKAIEGRDPRIGACADIGHFMRSGVNPIEALQKLEGRIISLHFKDLNEFGVKEAHDVIWGTGKADVEAVLKELDRQNFHGVFSFEYEHNWLNSVPEMRECVTYFNQVASSLKPTGWKPLFTADLSNAQYNEAAWKYEEGVLQSNDVDHGGDIWTRETYGNFVLDLEFKVPENGNSGVFIWSNEVGTSEWLHNCIEIQVHDFTDGAYAGSVGSLYNMRPPRTINVKPTGQWNHFTIICDHNKIYVLLNGKLVNDADIDQWTEPGLNPNGTKNKFKHPLGSIKRDGQIGLQYHGNPIWYRNLKIKEM